MSDKGNLQIEIDLHEMMEHETEDEVLQHYRMVLNVGKHIV